MARTEGMEVDEHGRVVWRMEPAEARQVATLIEMCEPDPFRLRAHLATDLRHFAQIAELARMDG